MPSSAFLAPTIDDILSRIEGDEFTTTEFIALLQSDPEANAAYLEALRRWGEGERSAKMVVHGQVIPGILRRSNLVEWLGFAHGEDDPYAVPGRWRLVGGRPRTIGLGDGSALETENDINSGWTRIVSAKIG